MKKILKVVLGLSVACFAANGLYAKDEAGSDTDLINARNAICNNAQTAAEVTEEDYDTTNDECPGVTAAEYDGAWLAYAKKVNKYYGNVSKATKATKK